MARDTRQKASDVFRETNFFLGEKVAFAKAFPSIETLRVEVEEDGDGVRYEWGRVSVYTQERSGEYINCSNLLCYNGGFRLGDILRHIVENKLTHHEAFEVCQGYEGSPKGRRKYRSCCNSFKVKVTITYKP